MIRRDEDRDLIREGEVVLFTAGEYSDYSAAGVAVALREFRLDQTTHDYKRSLTADADATTSGYLVWLCAERFIRPFPHMKVHVGDYSDVHPTGLSMVPDEEVVPADPRSVAELLALAEQLP